jgi:two-component system sensor histidine kinase DesK
VAAGAGAGAAEATTPAATTAGAGPRNFRRYPWVWATIWLVYLINPAQRALQDPNPVTAAISTAAVVLFAAVFISSFVVVRSLRQSRRLANVVIMWGALVMIGLITVAAFGVGQSALGMFIYVGVSAFFMLPTRRAVAVVATLMLACVVVPILVPGWQPDYSLAFQIFVIGVAVWGTVQIIDRNVQLAAAREEIARLAVNDERNRFARDLHDILGHTLTVVTVKAELAGRLVRISPERAEAEIADMERLSRQALHDVRSAVAGYRDVTLATELAGARSALSAAQIEADLPRGIDDVPADRQELFAWVVREGVTNVVRHSGARRCQIRVTANQIEVTDDGRGPAADAQPTPQASGSSWLDPARPGYGLAGLRERTEAAGGSLSVGRRAEGGFALRVRMP